MKQEHENLRDTVDAVPVRQQVERDQRTSQIHKRMRLAHFASEVLRKAQPMADAHDPAAARGIGGMSHGYGVLARSR